MAVLQKQYPRTLERQAAPPVRLPVTHRRYRTYTRAAKRARTISLCACLASAALLVAYIAGHARMTAVNYQRVQILSQTRSIQKQNYWLQSDILRKKDQAAVEAWARHHGLILDTREPLVLHP